MAPELAKECTNAENSLRLTVRTMAGPILARARFVEERLKEAIRKGISQYIILGVGFDTFAYRRLNLEKPDFLHYIAVDFTKDNS